MTNMTKYRAIILQICWIGITATSHANFLYDSYLVPGFDGEPNTEYSRWNILYSANLGENMPDAAAPNGTLQTASDAGFTPPSGSNPSNPIAYWSAANPTITQTNPGMGFIIGPGTTGNIYSFSGALQFELNDTTPYELGTVVFQFQTEGTQADLDTIKLIYTNGDGLQELSASEYIREYQAGSSAFGGFGNRNALQWDLSGLGITEYQIFWEAPGAHMSFQQALLDTADTYEAVVPGSRTWNGVGNQNWSSTSNWVQGSASVTNGNVRFTNADDANITLDGDRTVGEMTFETDSDVTISGASTLTANTGITIQSGFEATHTISNDFELGAFNLMSIDAGEVHLNGTVSGDYGFIKTGEGKLVLGANNTFGDSFAGIGVQGGTVRIDGTNTYGGSTAVLWGVIEVAANAPVSAAGAFGNSSSALIVGASSSTFSDISEPAQIVIDGDYTVARNINIEQGTFEKRLGASNTSTGAVYSGSVTLLGSGSNATNVKLFAQEAEDTVRFTGNISGGTTSRTVSINADGEEGTVIFSGSNKTYVSQTLVSNGTLLIDVGTSTTGNGAWTVSSGATLQVDGTLGGSGAFTLASGATLTGDGTVNKAFTIGTGNVISPGNSPGTMNSLSQVWDEGGSYLWEINSVGGNQGEDPGWDWLNITGTLSLASTELNPFEIEITSLDLSNGTGLVPDFVVTGTYSWIIASASDGITGFDESIFSINAAGFENHPAGNFGLQVVGNDLVLTYAIPEPSAAFLLGLGGLALAAIRRRNKFKPCTDR